jgi:hypothetical protein
MEAIKQEAYELLIDLGCCVEDIPESDERRADLRAVDATSTYLVEVKQKLDDGDRLEADSRRMADGEVISHSETLSHHNRVDAILKDGRDQLHETPQSNSDFRLVWFAADGIDRHVYWERAFATFYGSVQLLALKPHRIVYCFYFDYSAAWSMPTVEAMMLVDRDNLQLCLNEFSPRFESFRESSLCKRLSDAVVDPLQLLADNSIIALHSDVSRRNEDLVLDELFRQTGIRYITLRPQQHSASAMVERGDAT